MASGYEYKPKGIDISISAAKKRKKKKPEELPCEWAGCAEKGGCKAPKSPDRLTARLGTSARIQVNALKPRKNAAQVTRLQRKKVITSLVTAKTDKQKRRAAAACPNFNKKPSMIWARTKASAIRKKASSASSRL